MMGLHGPADLTFDEAAGMLSEALETPVAHVTVTLGQTGESLVEMGFHPDSIATFVQMYEKMDQGMEISEPRTSASTTPTDLGTFAREVMKPLLG